MRSKLVFAVAAVLGVFSCRTESISEVSTSEVTANINAVTQGSGSTEVSATFRKGAASLTFLQLTSDDTITVTSGGMSEELKELSLLGAVTYSASMPIDADGTQFTVALARKKDSGAPSSVATLPQSFAVDPLSGSFSRAAAGPMLHWSNAGSDPMKLLITGPCIDALSANLTSGATDYTVAAGALHKRQASGGADGGTTVTDDCQATVVIDRTHAGELDKGYEGGTVNGVQRRSVQFTTTP